MPKIKTDTLKNVRGDEIVVRDILFNNDHANEQVESIARELEQLVLERSNIEIEVLHLSAHYWAVRPRPQHDELIVKYKPGEGKWVVLVRNNRSGDARYYKECEGVYQVARIVYSITHGWYEENM